MKIIIKERGDAQPRTVRLPLRLAANFLTAGVAAKNTELSYLQAVRLMRAIRKASKQLQGTPLVEITEQNGDAVTVFL